MEDRRYLRHSGFEARAPLRVLKRLSKGSRAGGISTIDQQLIRICTGRFERSLRRKIREIFLAYSLNAHCSKSEIFHSYLKQSYFGYKLFGCIHAANFLFSKPAIHLTEEEAVFVAALLARPLPRPIYYSVIILKEKYDITPDLIIHLAETMQLDWADPIKLRYQYGLNNFPSTAKSLRIK
ncbi:hypothetical protein EU805_01350 [Salipiger sp. IMCC34102]|uniref:transglycosylase domain-containing protein n=1 Tax=Salipiger sp. IMCC34102 TaxID=2510647 RepID=UPI00101C8B6C|nr:hypothetical protein EU805_01350 [Salipiger sp. IMCC34102]